MPEDYDEINVTRSIREVEPGLRYEGDINIGDAKLTFQLALTFPITDPANRDMPATSGSVRQWYGVKLHNRGTEIELDEDEYNFFCTLIVWLAFTFYQEPFIGVARQAGHLPSSMTVSHRYKFTTGTALMLQQPKYKTDFN
jgi:hypothetical protein